MEKSVFDLVTEFLYERLDDIILQNPEYGKTEDEINKLTETLKSYKLNEEEVMAVNRLLCVYLTQNDCYSKLSYQHGFIDGVSLLREMGITK